ncbi:hypothetical protein, partial [Paenibacillus algorifonticola]|uniref:hypothetical protein n=1 Tax=Paenibacillus algorifonticola TaxID=684063 RepID=UPI001C42E6BE
IHAPHTECDANMPIEPNRLFLFQSTHPIRSATAKTVLINPIMALIAAIFNEIISKKDKSKLDFL